MARYEQYGKEIAYRSYVADSVMAIAKSMGVETQRRYAEIIYPKPVSNETGEEIAARIIARAGLKAKEEGGGSE